MMQQLLTTSRQLTLGAYKHETECMYSHIKHKNTRRKCVYRSSFCSISLNHCHRAYVFCASCVCSQRAGAEDQGENGSSEEENQPGDHRAERQTKSQQRKHQPPEGRDPEAGGGRRPQGALRNGQTHPMRMRSFSRTPSLFF